MLTRHIFPGRVPIVERGQASIEWLGTVALVAVVLTTAAGIAGGDAIASSVVRGIHRALCVVRGGICDLDRRPCVVQANATEDDAHVNLLFVRVGRTELILREHRSDGSILVTYLQDTSAGWDVGVGGDLWASAAGQQIVAGAGARAALLTSLGAGQTWSFDDPLDADVAMAQLGEGRDPTVGQRVSRFAGTGVEAAADAGGAWKTLHGALGLNAGRVHGTLVDERSGQRTHVVQRGAAIDAIIGRHSDGLAGSAEGEEHLSVTTDAHGRPLELSVARTGELRAAVDLPDIARPLADTLVGAGGEHHRRWVVEQRLDLTDPVNLSAAHAVLTALDGPVPMLAEADDALRARLDAAGVTEARTYGVAQDGGGVAGHAGVGAKVGGGLTDATENAQLLEARVLGPDGRWRLNAACGVG